MNTLLKSASVALFLSVSSIAWAAPAAEQEATRIVRTAVDEVLTHLKSAGGTLAPDARIAIVRRIIAPHVDFPHMTLVALGRHKGAVTDGQRERLARAIEARILRTYSAALASLDDVSVEIVGTRAAGKHNLAVRTRVHRAVGRPLAIDYRLRTHDGVWKVYDVRIEGVSLVLNYRATFAQLLASGTVEALISRLESDGASPS